MMPERSEAEPHRAIELAMLNRRLAGWLHTHPAELVEGADAALADALVVCGLLGGKDVGKSTLINALAGETVSVDHEEAGEGTSRPRAYIHRASEGALRARLRAIAAEVPLDVTFHEASAIERVVLLDLPDFDSEFMDHLRIVRGVTPLLDRVVWVMTPRKIVDRAWVAMSRQVIKDGSNTYCALNKLDELLADEDLFPANGLSTPADVSANQFWNSQRAWFCGRLSAAGFGVDENQCFQFAAAFGEETLFDRRVAELWDDVGWKRFAGDRGMVNRIGRMSASEIVRLREAVLAPLTAERARTLKEANASMEHAANARRIRRHYDLDRMREQLSPAVDPEYAERVLDEVFDADLRAHLAESVRREVPSDRDLADALLERRVEHWPLLRLAHWPFGWLSRLIGRSMTANRASADSPRPRRAVAYDRRLGKCIEGMRSRLLGDMAPAAARLQLDKRLPEASTLEANLEARLRSLAPRIEAELLDAIWPEGRRPTWIARMLLWTMAFWFVIAQPLLEGGLRMYTSRGALDLAEGAYHVVSTFSAARLGVSVLVVAAILAGVLAVLYANGLSKLRRLRMDRDASPIDQRIDESLVSEALVPLLTPFQEALARLEDSTRLLEE